MAMVVTTRLIKTTKYNASWMLFVVAIGLITMQRIDEFVVSLNQKYELGWALSIPHELSLWGGIVISVCIVVALFLIRKLILFIKVNELKRNDAQEKTLNAVIVAQESQRQKIAKELHDGLGPLLSTAQMSISAIKPSDDFQKEIVANAENAISLALKAVKSTSGALSSHVLENFGITSAISSVIKTIDPLKRINIKFYTNIATRRFVGSHELIVYRIVTELLNNSLKHSQADLVNLDLVWTGSHFELVYSDNGCGFDVKAPTIGMGLLNITSRVESVKGRIDIVSVKGGGMKVSISFASTEAFA